MDARDVREILDGLEDDHHHDGGTVGIGDDAAGTYESVGGIALGHYERNVGVHAESAGVVDHDRTVLGDGLSELLRSAGSGGSKRNVDILEIVVVLEKLDREILALELVGAAGAARRAEKGKLGDGEIAFFEYLEEFLADGAAGAYYGNVI